MFRRSILLLFGFLFFAAFNNAHAQGARLESGKYILGGITVTGKTSYNAQGIVTLLNLKKDRL